MSKKTKEIRETVHIYDDGCRRQAVWLGDMGWDANGGWQTYYVPNETAQMSSSTDCPIHSRNITENELIELRRKYYE